MKKAIFALCAAVATVIALVSCSNAEKTDKKEAPKFEVVSVTRVNSVESFPNSMSWPKDGNENGVLVILRLKSSGDLTVYSTDFSIAFEDDGTAIPRRPCVGIAGGMKSKDNQPSWLLGGSISRQWVDKDKPYFGVLFTAPKKITEFSLYYSAPNIKNIKIKDK